MNRLYARRKNLVLVFAIAHYLTALPVMVSGWFWDIEPWSSIFAAIWPPAFIGWMFFVAWVYGAFSFGAWKKGNRVAELKNYFAGFGAMLVGVFLFITVLYVSIELLIMLVGSTTELVLSDDSGNW